VVSPLILEQRYSLLKQIRRSEEVALFLVRDLRRDRLAALKVFLAPDEATLRTYSNHLALLSTLNHPHIARTIDSGTIEGPSRYCFSSQPGSYLFYATEYVPGPHLREAFTPDAVSQPAGLRALLQAVIQVCDALDYVHRRKLVHLDIKPENILLEGPPDQPEGVRVKLIDFDLSQRVTTPLGPRVRGTLQLVSPEVLTDSLVSEKSDLYSLGATLYLVISGAAPFAGPSKRRLIERIISEEPRPLQELNPHVPGELAQLVAELMAKKPADRPASAQEVKERLNRLLEETPAAPGSSPVSAGILRGPEDLGFVGREQTLRSLFGELDHLQRGEPLHHFLLIVGPSGTGKRRLFTELKRHGALHGTEVVQVDCATLRSQPYEALHRAVTKLSERLVADQVLRLQVEEASAFLAGGQSADCRFGPQDDPQRERKRFFFQLADLLITLTKGRPALLLFEHLELADPAELSFLAFLTHLLGVRAKRLGGADRRGAGLAFGGTLRALPPEGENSVLSKLAVDPATLVVRLDNLSFEATSELVRKSRGGSALPADVVAKVHGVTGGHPVYLADTLELLKELGPEDFGRHLEQLPSGIAAYFRYLANRAERTELLAAYALLAVGKPLPVKLLARAVGAAPGELKKRAGEGRLFKTRNGALSLRWWPAAGGLPQLAEKDYSKLLARLAEEVHRAGHIQDAARLYALAGRSEAVSVGIEYARVARRRLAWDGALKLLEEIRRCLHSNDPELLRLASELHELAGNVQAALDLLAHAALPPEGKARRSRALARLKAKGGEREEAFTLFAQARRAARNNKEEELSLEISLDIAALHLEAGELERTERLLTSALNGLREEREAKGRVLELLGRTAMARKNFGQAVTWFQKAAEHFEKTGSLHAFMRQLIYAGTASVMRGDFGKALTLFRHALALAHENRDPLGEALAHHKLGVTFYRRGETESALQHLKEARDLWEELGEERDLADSLNNLGLAYRSAGNLEEAVKHFKKSLDILSALGDAEGQAAVLNNLASVLDAHGRYREALTQSFRALELRKRQQDRFSIGYSYFRIGDIYRQMGELDHALSFARKSLSLREEVSDKLGLAHTLHLVGEIHLLQGRYGESLRRLRQGLIQFQALGDKIGKLPLLITLSRLYVELGSYAGAVEFLDQSEQIAEESGLRAYKAAARLVRALVKEAEEDLYGAETLLRETERLLQGEPARKNLAETLLHRARILFALGNRAKGLETLERSYALISDIGSRDLLPLYFLLRSEAELLAQSPTLETADRLVARALSEAQELSLLPLLAWIHLQAAVLSRRRGAEQGRREHIARAEEIVWQLQEDLPSRLRHTFTRSRLAQRIRKERETLAEAEGREAVALKPAYDAEIAAIRQRNRDLERLQEITRAINSELVLDKVLVRIIDAALELSNAERGFLIIGGGEKQTFRVARNLMGEDLPDPAGEISSSIAREVFGSGRPLVTNDAVGDVRLAKFKSVRDLKLMSIAALPLRVKDRTIGVLYLDNRTVKNAFRDDDLSLLKTLCDQAAIAIENARLIEENKKKQKELERSNFRIASLNKRLTEQLREKTQALQQAQHLLGDRFRFGNIIGKSKAMQEVFHIMERVAPTDLPVLIEGESGTGKELIANAIHFNSNRRNRPIISENCGAITSTLLESELFGHVKGAFTGAIREKKGLFELAHRGTLFLDEVGDMDLDMQKKLLRVLEEGEIRRVGGKDVIKVDVRLITATNRNLRELVQQGRFREDLFWRLNVIRIRIPPLRERKEDIPLLAEYFLEKIARERGGERKRLSPGALRKMLAYSWPGNVRELQHFLERAHLLARGPVIEEDEVILEGVGAEAEPLTPLDLAVRPFREAKDEFVRWYLQHALEEHGGVVSRAARSCGMSRETFHRLMRKYGLAHRGR